MDLVTGRAKVAMPTNRFSRASGGCYLHHHGRASHRSGCSGPQLFIRCWFHPLIEQSGSP